DYLGTGNYTVCRYKYQSIDFRVIDQLPLIKSPHNYIPPKNYVFELLLVFLLILCTGILSGTIIFLTLPQVVDNYKTLTTIYILLIKIGSLILLVQNILILGFVYLFQRMQSFKEMEIITFFIFHLDLLGFLLLAVGYLCFSNQSLDEKPSYLYGGLALLGWVISRIITQYVIPFGIILHEYQEPLDYQTFAFYLIYRGVYEIWYAIYYPGKEYIDLPPLILILSFILVGILLFLGSHFIQRARDDKSGSFFKWYGILNLMTIFSLLFVYYQEINLLGVFINNYVTIYLSFLFKIVGIPILGIITFFFMFQESSNLIEKQ
ncbi:MAG: hypothetical protein ACFE9L_14450, partial [Candidatus Hodarchaeota archaeon]